MNLAPLAFAPRWRPGLAARLLAGALCAALAGCGGTVPPDSPPAQETPPAPEEAPAAPAAPEDAAAPAAQAPAPAAAAPEPAPAGRFAGVARGEVRAALLVPLTGPRAAVGRALADAAQLALFEHAGPSFVLLPRDTRGAPEGAEDAMRAALADGADIALGPLLAASARRVAPLARGAGAPVLAFTNDRRAAADGVFVMGLTPGAQVARAVAHARALGRRRFAALAPEGPWGAAVAAALRAEAARHGAAVGAVVRYPPPGPGAESPAIESLAAARNDPERGFDALLIAAGGDTLAALAPLLPYHGIDPAEVLFLGVGRWKDPAILGEPALVGALFAAPADGAAWRGFAGRYREAFGADPPRIAALGYDAVALAAGIARLSGGAFDAAGLADPAGFAGIGGLFRFDADGVAERGLAVWRVARTGFEIVDPAPASFAPPAF